jgi:hypothetical protein
MTITTIANMQIVPEKFSQYVIDRTTELNTFVNSGIATPDATVARLINGVPEGGRFIQLPMWNPLDGEEDVFGEEDLSIGNITTKEARATLLLRGKAWGATDLAHVLGGADPMGAIAQLIADWRNTREQKIYLAILKGIFDSANGALKDHVNDISAETSEAAYISDGATLDTKQLLGDHYGSLGMVFMHSAVYTYLQKNGMITRNPIFDPSQSSVEMERYLGYQIKVDDGMPWIGYTKAESSGGGAITVTEENLEFIQQHCKDTIEVGNYVTKDANPVYDTYFVGKGAFIRQDGTPQGFIGTETDRDKLGGKNYLINRWCQIIHPRGLSWISDGTYTNPAKKYPANADLAKPENWSLVVDHKKVPLACLKHKIG